MLRVGSAMLCVGSARLFGYQHVGISSRQGSRAMRWGSRPTRGPNGKGFALWWNIGTPGWPVYMYVVIIQYYVCALSSSTYRVETEISICLETQKLLSQGPLIGQHSQLSSLHIRVTEGQEVGALVNAIFTLPVWVHS